MCHSHCSFPFPWGAIIDTKYIFDNKLKDWNTFPNVKYFDNSQQTILTIMFWSIYVRHVYDQL